MARVVLADVAFARPGDKGDISDLAVFTRQREVYDVLLEQVTADRVKELFGDWVLGEVRRYEMPNVLALKFVMEHALAGGGPASLRADNLGKSLGGAVLRLPVDVPDDVLARCGPRPTPPRDPYVGASWIVQR